MKVILFDAYMSCLLVKCQRLEYFEVAYFDSACKTVKPSK